MSLKLIPFLLSILLFNSYALAEKNCASIYSSLKTPLLELSAKRDAQVKRNLKHFTARGQTLTQALVEYYGYKIVGVKPKTGRRSVYKYFAAPTFFERKIDLLKALGLEYPTLLFHHRIVSQTKEFVDFIKSLDNIPEDPWIALNIYRRHLGKKTVYRALALTSEEAKSISENGMMPPRINPRVKYNKTPITYRVKLHLGGRGKKIGMDHELQSVTSYPEIARAVTERFKEAEKKVYLFKIRIDDFDLIKGSWRNPDSLILFQGLERYFNNQIVIKYGDGKIKKIPYGPTVESLVLGKISAEEILSYEETDSYNPGFSVDFEQKSIQLDFPNFR